MDCVTHSGFDTPSVSLTDKMAVISTAHHLSVTRDVNPHIPRSIIFPLTKFVDTHGTEVGPPDSPTHREGNKIFIAHQDAYTKIWYMICENGSFFIDSYVPEKLQMFTPDETTQMFKICEEIIDAITIS